MPSGGPQRQEPHEEEREDAELHAHLREDEECRRRYKDALQLFLRASAQRKRRFEALKRQDNEHESKEASETPGNIRKYEPSEPPPPRSRLFILSKSEEPWNVFVADSQSSSSFLAKLRLKRLVFEWSGLHFSALHVACGSGNRALVRKLLTVSIPPPVSSESCCCSLARDASGRIPLHHAVIREQHKVVKVLLKHSDARLQTHVRDNCGYSAAHYALLKLVALAHQRHLTQPPARATVSMKRVSKRYRRLWRTADRLVSLVHPAFLNSIMSGNDDLDYSLKALDLRCRGDEWDATRSGDLERLQFLLKVYNGNHNPDPRDSSGLPVLSELRRSLLHEACDCQQLPIVCYLVTQYSARFKLFQDASGCTALHYAAMRGFLEGCVMLLEEQCGGGGDDDDDVDALCLSVDSRGRTPLHWSLLSNGVSPQARVSVAKYLVGECASALHVQDNDGLTPLHLAITRGDVAIVQLFVQLGADVNASLRIGGGELGIRSKVTAAWAPCGAHFHGEGRKAIRAASIKSPALDEDEDEDGGEQSTQSGEEGVSCESTQGRESNGEEERELMEGDKESTADSKSTGSDLNPQGDMASGDSADENSVVMDTLWYWLHSKKQKNKKKVENDTTKNEGGVVAESVPGEPQSDEEPAPAVHADIHDEEDDENSSARGCRKYGGMCRECAANHAETTTSAPAAGSVRMNAISPLVLAIRACRRRLNALEQKKDRVGIVEFLLLSGADPNQNGSFDGEDSVENDRDRVSSSSPPLMEALSVAADECEDRPSSVPPLLSAFFEARSFNLLTKLLHLLTQQHFHHHHHQRSSFSEADGDQETGSGTSPRSRPLCLWEAIRLGLSQKQSKSRSLGRHSLERKHLWFLCESRTRSQLQEPRQELQHHNQEDDEELRRLLSFCVGICLAKWRSEAKLALVDGQEHFERQRMVSSCLKLLILSPGGDQRDELNGTGPGLADYDQCLERWLDHFIALGFFDCALALINHQQHRELQSVSIDRLLTVYEDQAPANRHHLLGFPGHSEFLLALLEIKCKADPEADPTHEPKVVLLSVSMESVVRVCAFSLPLQLVQKLLSLALFNQDALDKFRVGGKTLCEWLVHHERRDLIQFLLEHEALAQERRRLWRDCVSAATVVAGAGSVGVTARPDVETEPKRELLSWLLSVYPAYPDFDSIGDEDKELKLIRWLVLNRAVRCDSPLLFTAIIAPLWSKRLASSHAVAAEDEKAQGDNNDGEEKPSQHQVICSSTSAVTTATPALSKLATALLEMNVFHELARWNAIRLATYLTQELFAKTLTSDETHTTSKCRQALIAKQGADDSSALEICYALGHAELAQLFLDFAAAARSSEVNSETSNASQDLQLSSHGLFSTIVRLNNTQVQENPQHHHFQAHQVSRYRRTMVIKQDERLGVFQSECSWQTACRFNLVTHLEALKVHQVPVKLASNSLQGLPGLLQIAIDSGSLDALRWLLSYHDNNNNGSASTNSSSRIKDPEVQTLYDAASRHSSDLYAHMTLLLLEYLPYTGRLAGDGADVTLLHRCVCFASPSLMQQAVSRVLAIPGTTVNVLDAFGNSPVVYAAISGNLAALCFLVQSHQARLEAEFEGQTSFYYSLQLLPSFSWRWVLKKVLVEKCQRRFLHCSGGESDDESSSCGCKGFEAVAGSGEANEPLQSSDNGDADGDSVCGFCGHGAEHHSRVPFPPWFMDQYETYLGVTSAGSSSSSHSSDGGSDSEGDGDEDECASKMRGRKNEGEGECDESALEDRRGRLNATDLSVISAGKYAGIITEYGLSTNPELDDGVRRGTPIESFEPPEALARSNANDPDTTTTSILMAPLPFENLDPVEGWALFPLPCRTQDKDNDRQHQGMKTTTTNDSLDKREEPTTLVAVDNQEEQEHGEPRSGDNEEAVADLGRLPWHLRIELNAIHPPSCHCHNHDFSVTKSMWKYEVVSRWLGVSASRYCSSLSSQLKPAASRTALPFRILRHSKWTTLQLTFGRWRKEAHSSPQSLASTRLSLLPPRRRRKLQQFLSHWRFANAFVAFQHWKYSSISKSVHHMQLESLFEQMVTQMRVSRFEALQERHKQLYKSISLASGGDWEHQRQSSVSKYLGT